MNYLMYSRNGQGVLISFSLAERKFKIDTTPKNTVVEAEIMKVDTSKPVEKFRDKLLFIKRVDQEMETLGFKRIK